MRQILLLLKTTFLNTYNINKLLNIKKSRLFLYILLAIYVVFSLFITFYSYAKEGAYQLMQYHLIEYLIVLFFVGASLSTFMFTIYNAKSSMFNANDNDLLLSMPIKSSTILASRLIFITLWNLLTSLFLMVPAFVVYAKNVDVPLAYYPIALVVFLFLPVIPTILASIVGYFVAYFTSKSNIKNLFEIAMYFIMIAVIYLGMSKMGDILNYINAHVENVEEFLKWCFYPVYLVGKIFSDYNVVLLLVYVLLNIVLFVLFTYLLSINFKRIIARLQENRSKSNYKLQNLKTESIGKVLFIKEFKRYISSPIYVFNTLTGIIILIIGSIASIFYDSSEILGAIGMEANGNVFAILIPVLMFIIFLSNTTAVSISLEGKNYWILKTLPIEPIRIFKGKILLNLIVVLPVVYISLVILNFTLNLTIIQVLSLVILSTITVFTSVMFGLLVNLKFPKMDAINDVVVVKRSASVMISILVPMAIIFGLSGLYSLVCDIINLNILMVILMIILFVICVLEYRLLNTWGIRRFKEIE